MHPMNSTKPDDHGFVHLKELFAKAPWQAFEYYDRLRRIKQAFEESPSTVRSVADAARLACLTPSHFSTYFQKRTGVHCADWLRGMRLSHALTLIKSTDMPLKAIAQHCGYGSLRTFQRALCRASGSTATDLRRAHSPQIASASRRLSHD